MPLEFESLSKEKQPRYLAAPSWKSPRVLVTHVPKQLLPDQLRAEQCKAKVGARGRTLLVRRARLPITYRRSASIRKTSGYCIAMGDP